MRVSVLNGPNLNRLGRRPKEQYGSETLEQLVARVQEHCTRQGWSVGFQQSNHEGALIDGLYEVLDESDAIVINPAGLTSYGRSLADALAECGVPVAVVHISQPYRHRGSDMADVFRDRADVYVCGLGWRGYTAAIDRLAELVTATTA